MPKTLNEAIHYKLMFCSGQPSRGSRSHLRFSIDLTYRWLAPLVSPRRHEHEPIQIIVWAAGARQIMQKEYEEVTSLNLKTEALTWRWVDGGVKMIKRRSLLVSPRWFPFAKRYWPRLRYLKWENLSFPSLVWEENQAWLSNKYLTLWGKIAKRFASWLSTQPPPVVGVWPKDTWSQTCF